ncbi:glycoside hydrolase family 30 beta sandwich domain-containing protein [Dysgonomonas sp. 25]|uniref:glycoside hydrolase family 30 protein n=1 Tax=Dysgonomonas sp. 25 TaxID=2302933 RepID=UPI0013D7F38C|nr:glycoside hydrolase family 30 beta sandwich domain-containing protein [Dysgonomonas sp. 25]NDV70253.1 glucosylceramidase [Dysgonomonas sp. 25]
MKKNVIKILFLIAIPLLWQACSSDDNNDPDPDPNPPVETADVDVYVTTGDESMLFQHVPVSFNKKDNMSPYTVTLSPNTVYQEMEGFGAAFTGSTCYNLLKMSAENRAKLLKETFDPETGMGYSYIRISIGASDFSLGEYTYCDNAGIENFALHEYDKRDVIPVLKEILAINPAVKIMASPWTCPRWMKVDNLTNMAPYNSWTGGQLNPAYYADYATYFVKYIQAMKNAGIDIESITVQNEPLNGGNSASLYMTWQEQRDFIKNNLGPAFYTAGIETKIIVYDHNYNYDNISDQQSYPAKIYADSDAAQFIHGSAFHAYGGDKSELMNIHNAYPDKGLYFTEISIGDWGYTFASDLMWNAREVCIGTINNYCKAVLVWNFMLDADHGPYRPGGCNQCLGAVTLNASNTDVKRNSHFYTIGHLAKVIKPGAQRIKTSGYTATGLYYAGFKNTDGTYGVVLQNESQDARNVTVALDNKSFTYSVPANSMVSYLWEQ